MAKARRVTDQTSMRGKAMFFFHVWGRDIWLFATTVVAMWAAITGHQASVHAKEATTKTAALVAKGNADAQHAKAQALAQCQRSQKLAPPFVRLLTFAERQHLVMDGKLVIKPEEVALYKAIIPTKC